MDFWSLSRDSALRMSIFHREKMPLVTITPFNYLVFSMGEEFLYECYAGCVPQGLGNTTLISDEFCNPSL